MNVAMELLSDFCYFEHGSIIIFGNFDGVHLGHQDALLKLVNSSKALGLTSIVITFNPHPIEFFCKKNDFKIIGKEQKVSLVKDFGVDVLCTLVFDSYLASMSSKEFISTLSRKMNAKAIVASKKCSFGKGGSGNLSLIQDLSSAYGYEVIEIDTLKVDGISCSSSIIRSMIKSGEVDIIPKFLGRYYSITSIVRKGKGVAGSQLLFPTANFVTSEILPKFGVYVVELKIKSYNQKFFGVANVGLRPTFQNSTNPILEVHIIDFNENIYHKRTEITFLKFLREEIKFNSIALLSKQILYDIDRTKQFFSNYL